MGGHDVARKIWKDYIGTVNGIIFMIDTTDIERFYLVKEELDKLIELPEMADVPICILANKIDMAGSVPEEELRETLGLLPHQTYGKDPSNPNAGNRKIEIFMCSVMKRIGYVDGFQWVSSFLD